nr:MAG: hypothetical protein [Jingmen bat astrovirus 1]
MIAVEFFGYRSELLSVLVTLIMLALLLYFLSLLIKCYAICTRNAGLTTALVVLCVGMVLSESTQPTTPALVITETTTKTTTTIQQATTSTNVSTTMSTIDLEELLFLQRPYQLDWKAPNSTLEESCRFTGMSVVMRRCMGSKGFMYEVEYDEGGEATRQFVVSSMVRCYHVDLKGTTTPDHVCMHVSNYGFGRKIPLYYGNLVAFGWCSYAGLSTLVARLGSKYTALPVPSDAAGTVKVIMHCENMTEIQEIKGKKCVKQEMIMEPLSCRWHDVPRLWKPDATSIYETVLAVRFGGNDATFGFSCYQEWWNGTSISKCNQNFCIGVGIKPEMFSFKNGSQWLKFGKCKEHGVWFPAVELGGKPIIGLRDVISKRTKIWFGDKKTKTTGSGSVTTHNKGYTVVVEWTDDEMRANITEELEMFEIQPKSYMNDQEHSWREKHMKEEEEQMWQSVLNSTGLQCILLFIIILLLFLLLFIKEIRPKRVTYTTPLLLLCVMTTDAFCNCRCYPSYCNCTGCPWHCDGVLNKTGRCQNLCFHVNNVTKCWKMNWTFLLKTTHVVSTMTWWTYLLIMCACSLVCLFCFMLYKHKKRICCLTKEKLKVKKGTIYIKIGSYKTTNKCTAFLLFCFTCGLVKPVRAIVMGPHDVGRTFSNGSHLLTFNGFYQQMECRIAERAICLEWTSESQGMKHCCSTFHESTCFTSDGNLNTGYSCGQRKNGGWFWNGCTCAGQNTYEGCCHHQCTDLYPMYTCAGGNFGGSLEVHRGGQNTPISITNTGTYREDGLKITISGCRLSDKITFAWKKDHPPLTVDGCESCNIDGTPNGATSCSMTVDASGIGSHGDITVYCVPPQSCTAVPFGLNGEMTGNTLHYLTECDVDFEWEEDECSGGCDYKIVGCFGGDMCYLQTSGTKCCLDGVPKPTGQIIPVKCSGCNYKGHKWVGKRDLPHHGDQIHPQTHEQANHFMVEGVFQTITQIKGFLSYLFNGVSFWSVLLIAILVLIVIVVLGSVLRR